jgi:hypothetical protein
LQGAVTFFLRAARRFTLQGAEQIGVIFEFQERGTNVAPQTTQVFGLIGILMPPCDNERSGRKQASRDVPVGGEQGMARRAGQTATACKVDRHQSLRTRTEDPGNASWFDPTAVDVEALNEVPHVDCLNGTTINEGASGQALIDKDDVGQRLRPVAQGIHARHLHRCARAIAPVLPHQDAELVFGHADPDQAVVRLCDKLASVGHEQDARATLGGPCDDVCRDRRLARSRGRHDD